MTRCPTCGGALEESSESPSFCHLCGARPPDVPLETGGGWGRRPLAEQDVFDLSGRGAVDGRSSTHAGWVEVDRIHRLAWDGFTPADWASLARIYAELDGWAGDLDGPRWFGSPERPPFLVASVEPPGLQVSGRLDEARWCAWDAAFRASLRSLPVLDPE